MKIVWNYDDVDSYLISVLYKKKYIGYFRMQTEEFVTFKPGKECNDIIPIDVLRQIVTEYDDALNTAKKMIKQ